MKASVVSIASIFFAAAIVEALPNYLNLPDDFKVSKTPPPPNNNKDNRKRNKVVGVVTRFDGDNRQVLLTKAQGSTKGFELIRGKQKMGETSHQGVNREAFEEVGVHGIVDKKTKIVVPTFHKGTQEWQEYTAHIVKVPKNQDFAHNNENRHNMWVDHKDVPKHIIREDMLRVWEQAGPIIAKDYPAQSKKVKTPRPRQKIAIKKAMKKQAMRKF